MADSTTSTAQKRPSEWILQIPHPVEDGAWKDAARVKVPASTRRKTALRMALAEWGEKVPREGIPCRLIRLEDARALLVKPRVETEQQLVID